MATKINKTETEIKTDGIEMVQRNYFEKKQAREREMEIAKAEEYSLECERKRQQRKDKMFAIGTGIVGAALLFTMVSCYKPSTPSTETNTTPKSCKVVETYGNRITVECRGELYAFYGDGFSEGEMITCYFTRDGKIVDAE